MAINFPPSPTTNDTYSEDNLSWRFDGVAWVILPAGYPLAGSDTVTYTAAGSGAVATTVENKLRENVSVKDFGAVGDGVANDSPAFQAAYDSIPSGETRHILVPSGTYLTNDAGNQAAGGSVVWNLQAEATLTGVGRIPREWAMTKESANGVDSFGTLRIGANSGSVGNRDNNGALVFGGFSGRDFDDDDDGIVFKPEGSSSHFMQIYNNREGGQTQLNFQCRGVWGTVNTNGNTVTRVSGRNFNVVEAARFITINYVKYEIQSIDSADQITLVASAGTQSGVKYRIASTYQKVTCDISGTTCTRVSGEWFSSSVTVAFINGVRYAATYVSTSELTLGVAAGDATGVTVFGMPNESAAVTLRMQLQPGSNEQSMVWAYREDGGYNFSSVTTGTGEHRPLTINMGAESMTFNTNGFVDQSRRLTLDSSAYDEHLRILRGAEEWTVTTSGNDLVFRNVTSSGTPRVELQTVVPRTNNAMSLGVSGKVWAEGYITTVKTGDGTTIVTSGTGSPEGVVTAATGSMYTDRNGGTGTTLYIKESGTGNTGWVAK